MPFSLQQSLTALITAFPDQFHTIWWFTSLALLAVLFCIIVFCIFTDRYHTISNTTFICFGALLIIVCRLPNFCYTESNPDERQWLASVITIQQDPLFYFKEFYIYDFGRWLTIFPLLLISQAGIAIDYGLAKLTGIIFWITFFFFYFLFIQDIFNRKTALISSSLLLVFLAALPSWDYISYNSEIPAIALLSAFFFFYHQSLGQKNTKLLTFFVGALLACTFFAKLQSIYIILVCGIFCCAIYYHQRGFLQAFIFVLGGGLCSILFFLPVFVFTKYQDLLQVISIVENHAKFGNLYNNLSWHEKLGFIYLEKRGFFFLVPILSFFALLALRTDRTAFWNRYKGHVSYLIFFAVFYAASFYTVMSPHDIFPHYTLYLVLPSAYLAALVIDDISQRRSKKFTALYCSVFFIIIAFSGLKTTAKLWDRYFGDEPIKRSNFSSEILKHAHAGDKMLIWGSECRLYIETKLTRGSRYWYINFLNPDFPSSITNSVAANYEEDILNYKPEIIVELIGEDEIMSDPRLKIENYPSIAALVNQRYKLVFNEGSKKIYLLNKGTE